MAGSPLPRRKLGRTDMVVTSLALGGVGLGGVRPRLTTIGPRSKRSTEAWPSG